MQQGRVIVGDCMEVLRGMLQNSVDAIVTDPPYGLSFTGNKWDAQIPCVEIWSECLRVLKPGGHLLAFGGTRTHHRMCVNIEDAGFEIRDMIAWVYGTGFPKSHNGDWGGTALKPAIEPITVARKPLAGTTQANWDLYGTGGLNIAECRVGESKNTPASPRTAEQGSAYGDLSKADGSSSGFDPNVGRWPANLIHDGSPEVVQEFPYSPGQMGPISASTDLKTNAIYGRMRGIGEASADSANVGVVEFKMRPGMRRLDQGSAARFFYCAKASKADSGSGNTHPTVKPVELMRYLVRLVTPACGVVLDPFGGSGTTGVAAIAEGVDFTLIEINPEYAKMAEDRIFQARLDY